MPMTQMLLNTPVTTTGTYFFWEFTANNGGANTLIADLRFTSEGVVYPPNMTSNTSPTPYVASCDKVPSGGSSFVYQVFDSASASVAWSNANLPFVVTLFVGTPSAKPTTFSVSIRLSGASLNQSPANFKFAMGNTSNYASATLLRSITGETWAGGASLDTHTFTIP